VDDDNALRGIHDVVDMLRGLRQEEPPKLLAVHHLVDEAEVRCDPWSSPGFVDIPEA